jgi:hypothetical protein
MCVFRLILAAIVLGVCVIRAEASGPVIAAPPTVVNFGVVITGGSRTLYVTAANLRGSERSGISTRHFSELAHPGL